MFTRTILFPNANVKYFDKHLFFDYWQKEGLVSYLRLGSDIKSIFKDYLERTERGSMHHSWYFNQAWVEVYGVKVSQDGRHNTTGLGYNVVFAD